MTGKKFGADSMFAETGSCLEELGGGQAVSLEDVERDEERRNLPEPGHNDGVD